MFVWRDLDTKSALKRLKILGILSSVPLFVVSTFTIYFNFVGYSFSFFTGYALFEYTSLGIKWGGEWVIPVFTGTTVSIVAIFFISLPFVVIGSLAAFFTRPFEDVKGFEKFGKVREEVKSFIVRGSKREKLHVAAFTLTWILMFLFWSLLFLGWLGILVLNTGLAFLGLLFAINLLGALYFGGRVEQALKNYAETVQT
ncbi:MAG: hypothetical protein ACETWM_07950 [Candidatus Lokiarchaeia archaeon]